MMGKNLFFRLLLCSGLFVQCNVICAQANQDNRIAEIRTDNSTEATEELIQLAFEDRYRSPAKYITAVRNRVSTVDETSDPVTRAKLENLLGLLYRNIGLVDSAAIHFLNASSLYENLENEKFNSADYNLMNLYASQMHDPIQALQIGQDLLAQLARLNDKPRMIMTLDALAQVYWKLYSVDLALGKLVEGLNLSKTQELDSAQVGQLYGKLALYSAYSPMASEVSLNFLDSAANYLMSGCYERAVFLSLKGEILEMNGRSAEALKVLEEAESMSDCFDSPSALETIYYRTYSAALVEGNADIALEYIIKYDSVRSMILDEAKVTAINHFQTLYETEKKEAAIVRLEQENHISDLQKNFFIVLTFLFLAIATAVVIIYSNKLRHNKVLSEERIAKLEQEREVMNLQSMLYAQEEERRRIARDLHDGIGALLSAAKLHINNVEAELKKLTELDVIRSTEEVIDRANKEVRRVAHNMMPGVLIKLGLFEGIEDFFDRMRDSTKIKISFTYDEFEERFDNKTDVMIYRIVQELVNNTLKHAHASEIKLMIKKSTDGLQLDYRDDGMGFDTAGLDDQSNFGLSGIKSRVNFLNGDLKVISTRGQGVHFSIKVPITITEES